MWVPSQLKTPALFWSGKSPPLNLKFTIMVRIIANILDSKTNPDWVVLTFEPTLEGDVLTIPESKPFEKSNVEKFKLQTGSKIRFEA